MKKYRIPKNIIQLPFKTNISVLLLASVLLSFAFVSLSIIEGIQNNIKKNISQNYNSHWSVSKSQDLSQLESWWDSTPDEITKLQENEYVRGITTRSTLDALYKNHPLHITIIEDNDTNVFDSYMLPEKMIAPNQIHIGRPLDTKLGVDIGQSISLYIPSLNKTLSNLTVEHIFEPVDIFYGDYGVYIHKSSISSLVDSRFQKYHVRFLASPLLHLVESTVDNSIFQNNIKRADDLLEYQYLQLNSIKKIIHQCIYIIYILLGFLFFLFSYSVHNQQKLDSYAYRSGFVQRQFPTFRFLTSCATKLVSSTILAMLITYAFVQLSIELDSTSWTSSLYSEYNLPLTYHFSAKFPWLTSIPLGIVLGLLANGSLLLCMKIKNAENPDEYRFLIMFGVALLGILTSYQYININFARESRNSHWRQYFFGRHMLAVDNYHEFNSFKITPTSFSFPVDSFNIFQENQLGYMASYETYGEISTVVLTNADKKAQPPTKKRISVKSLQGNLSQFSNISLENHQIVVGKNLVNYFIDDNPATLLIPHKNAETTLSITNAPVVDIPVGDFNDTVFVNHSNLMSLLELEVDQITKLQFVGRKKYLTPLTNDQASITSLGENVSHWNKLSDVSILALFVNTLLLGVCCAVFVLAMILNHSTSKEVLFTNYIWGIDYNPFRKNSIIYACCFAIGVCLSWVINLIACLQKQTLPDFLYIPYLVPKSINYSPSWTVVPLLLVGFALFFIVVFYIFICILKQMQNTANKQS